MTIAPARPVLGERFQPDDVGGALREGYHVPAGSLPFLTYKNCSKKTGGVSRRTGECLLATEQDCSVLKGGNNKIIAEKALLGSHDTE